jgi:hypothetical protein
MNNLISSIRSYDPSSIIMLEEVDWSCNWMQSYPVTGSNLVYSFHLYADETGGGNDQVSIETYFGYYGVTWLNQHGYCVVFGEYGGDSNGGNTGSGGTYGGMYSTFSLTWIQNFLTVCNADRYAGYDAYNWGLGTLTMPLITDWYGNPSPSGTVVRSYYLSH